MIDKNKILLGIIFTVFVGLSISGVGAPGSYNLLPATAIFEVLLVVIFIFNYSLVSATHFWPVLLLSGSYLMVSFVLSVVVEGAHMFDFFQAYKAFYYICILSFLVGVNRFSGDMLFVLFKIVLFAMLFKYGYSKAFGFSSRPGLYMENNFELVFALLLYFTCDYAGKIKGDFYFVMLVVLVVISGSRSVLLSLMILYVYKYFKTFGIKTLIAGILLPVLLAVGVFVFIERLDGGGIEDIDRFKFLTVFLYDVSDWNILRYLYGNVSLQPLSLPACMDLSYYQNLFSYSRDNSCYSVILHSYILRVIYDHGLLGFVFISLFFYNSLRSSGYDKRSVFCILMLLLSCSLSVSSVNSVYVVLGMVFLLGVERRKIND